MGFNIGPKYKLVVLVISKILAHDYIFGEYTSNTLLSDGS